MVLVDMGYTISKQNYVDMDDGINSINSINAILQEFNINGIHVKLIDISDKCKNEIFTSNLINEARRKRYRLQLNKDDNINDLLNYEQMETYFIQQEFKPEIYHLLDNIISNAPVKHDNTKIS